MREELSGYGDEAATVTCEVEFSAPAGMYFTEVEPTRPGAASLSIAHDGSGGGDTLHLTFGHTSFELFPFQETDLGYLRDLVQAVLAGRVEESGSVRDGHGRIYTNHGVVRVGAMHLPLPWRLRKTRRYEPYGAHL